MGCFESRIAVYAEEEEQETNNALQLLGFSIDDTLRFIKVFDKCEQVDKKVTYQSALKALGMPDCAGSRYFLRRTRTNFKETIIFRNFCLNVWMYATRSQEQLASMCFDAYLEIQKDELDSRGIFRLIYDLYGNKEIDYKAAELLKEVERDNEETLTKYEFMNHCYKYRSILRPLYELQRSVQDRVLGYSYWVDQISAAPRLLAERAVAEMFKPLPSIDYNYRERVSRYPSLAIANSYRKQRRLSVGEGDEEKAELLHKTMQARRKSSILEQLAGGGEVPRGIEDLPKRRKNSKAILVDT